MGDRRSQRAGHDLGIPSMRRNVILRSVLAGVVVAGVVVAGVVVAARLIPYGGGRRGPRVVTLGAILPLDRPGREHRKYGQWQGNSSRPSTI